MNASLALLFLAKVTIVVAIGLTAIHVTRKSRAAVRHVLLAATFAALLVLPLASIVAPSIVVTMPAAVVAPAPVTAEPMVEAETGVTPMLETSPMTGPPASEARVPVAFVFGSFWIAGLTVCLLPVAAGLWQLRALRASALPWPRGESLVAAIARENGIRRQVSLLLHESSPGPTTFGVVRPTLVLPIDAERWNDEDLRRAVIHELEHVRRGDWLTQCVTRVVCAAYWFHPLVWIAQRRFALEAERACDDAVLRRCEPTAYADQLVALARRLSAGARQPLLAMASRADLFTRVVAVLDGRQPRGRAGAAWIAAAAATALALVVTMSPIQLVAARAVPDAVVSGQTKQRYDAATLKRCVEEPQPTGARGTYGGTNASYSPGRFAVPCVTAGQLIYLAYAAAGVDEGERLINDDPGTAASPQKVRGGPDWVHSLREKYAVEATAAGVTDRTVLMGAMLRTLLEERFRLRLHRETEDTDMYALTVARGGLKIAPMKDGDCEPHDGSPIDPGAAKPTCGNLSMMSVAGRTRWVFGGTTLSNLAAMISRPLGVRVVDRTNIKDQFIIRLEFLREARTDGTSVIRDASGRVVTEIVMDAPPIPTALEQQLGLKLEKTRAPRGYLVIDHIERPTPDAPSAPPARAAGAGRN